MLNFSPFKFFSYFSYNLKSTSHYHDVDVRIVYYLLFGVKIFNTLRFRYLPEGSLTFHFAKLQPESFVDNLYAIAISSHSFHVTDAVELVVKNNYRFCRT